MDVMITKAVSILMILAVLAGCRAYNYAHSPSVGPRPIEVSALDEKLTEIHFYSLVAHKHELSGNWTKARTARVEIDKVEQSILRHLRKHPQNRGQFIEEITNFAAASALHNSSVQHLAWLMNLKFELKKLGADELERELATAKITREFQVYETNVEHLSYVTGSNARL